MKKIYLLSKLIWEDKIPTIATDDVSMCKKIEEDYRTNHPNEHYQWDEIDLISKEK